MSLEHLPKAIDQRIYGEAISNYRPPNIYLKSPPMPQVEEALKYWESALQGAPPDEIPEIDRQIAWWKGQLVCAKQAAAIVESPLTDWAQVITRDELSRTRHERYQVWRKSFNPKPNRRDLAHSANVHWCNEKPARWWLAADSRVDAFDHLFQGALQREPRRCPPHPRRRRR
jgi:hypothetical protein